MVLVLVDRGEAQPVDDLLHLQALLGEGVAVLVEEDDGLREVAIGHSTGAQFL